LINNRQAGRRRGRGNNNSGGGSGGGQRQGGGGGQGGRDTGNRIDSRARGNASQLYEKYKNLARDAQQQGDRVNIEYYLQFADHYFRVLSETRARFEESQPQAQQQPRRQQPFDLDGDDDYGDEGEPIRSGEQQGTPDQARGEQNRVEQNGGQQNGQYQNAPRQNREFQNREDRPQREDRPRYENRYEGQRNEGPRNEGQRNEGQRSEAQREDRVRNDNPRNQRNARDGQARDAQPRDAQPRDGQARDDRSGEDQAQDREAQAREIQPSEEQVRAPRSDYRDSPQRETIRRTPRASAQVANPNQDSEADVPRSVTETTEQAVQPTDGAETTLSVAATEEQPRRRGRPRRDRSLDAPVSKDQGAPDDAAPTAFDADRLPPSLGISAVTPAPTPTSAPAPATDAAPAADVPAEEKPRRRRVRAVPDEVQAD
jgi:hypothetical protein